MVSEWLLVLSEYGTLRRRAARMPTLAGKVEEAIYEDGGQGWVADGVGGLNRLANHKQIETMNFLLGGYI